MKQCYFAIYEEDPCDMEENHSVFCVAEKEQWDQDGFLDTNVSYEVPELKVFDEVMEAHFVDYEGRDCQDPDWKPLAGEPLRQKLLAMGMIENKNILEE